MVQLAKTYAFAGPRVISLLQKRSYTSSSPVSELENTLTRRRLPIIYDYLTPQPSHLLNLSLASSLSESHSPASTTSEAQCTLPSILKPSHMPIGHHLVYFPPQIPSSQLLPDGTDELHSPGDPFNRRMWAGGSVRFFDQGGPLLNGQRAVCVEGIRDAKIKGREGEEKIFVGIERRIATIDERENDKEVRSRVWTQSEDEQGDSLVIERRNLVFMRDRTPDEINAARAAKNEPRRAVKGPGNPEFRNTITPSKALLFRYSALTFNAHSIHLDRDYARNTEGYEDLLVHGPLILTIMLTSFKNHIAALNRTVSSIEYRNLAPLLVEREMTVCGKPKPTGDDSAWDIWVEGGDGGLVVRGTVQTRMNGSS